MHIEKQKLGYGDMNGDDASHEVVREIARDPDVYTRLSQVINYNNLSQPYQIYSIQMNCIKMNPKL